MMSNAPRNSLGEYSANNMNDTAAPPIVNPTKNLITSKNAIFGENADAVPNIPQDILQNITTLRRPIRSLKMLQNPVPKNIPKNTTNPIIPSYGDLISQSSRSFGTKNVKSLLNKTHKYQIY